MNMTNNSRTTTEKMRLDKAVQQEGHISRAQARRLILCGQVKINGQICRILAKEVSARERITIDTTSQPQIENTTPAAAAKAGDLIIYQDKYLLIINKPAGIVCEESHDSRAKSVIDLLKETISTHPSDRFYLVHRLDATTTGVLIVARRPAAADNLFSQFRAHTVRKSYLALSAGHLKEPLELSGPIGRSAPGAQKHQVRPDGKEAFTKLTPLSYNNNVTLTLAEPTTGRTHQIRVHSSSAGFPLLGDKLYGGPRLVTNNDGLTRPCQRALLHAYTIDFTHPADGRPLHFEAPLPDDMIDLMEILDLKN